MLSTVGQRLGTLLRSKDYSIASFATMDVYKEATKEKKIESFARLEGKISIAVT